MAPGRHVVVDIGDDVEQVTLVFIVRTTHRLHQIVLQHGCQKSTRTKAVTDVEVERLFGASLHAFAHTIVRRPAAVSTVRPVSTNSPRTTSSARLERSPDWD